MMRTILGLHAGAGEHGVHSVLIDVPGHTMGERPVFRLGMFQAFPFEVCRWLAKAGDKPSGESRYFENACKIISEQFANLALLTIKEAGMSEDSIFAVGCDSTLGAGEGSRRFLAFKGWGPGQDIAQATGLSSICINSDVDLGRSNSPDHVFSYPAECLFGRENNPVLMLHLGGMIKISGFAKGCPVLNINGGPCASFFELLLNSENLNPSGVDFVSKLAVQGKLQESLLCKWKAGLARSLVLGKSKNRFDHLGFLEEIKTDIKEHEAEDLLCAAHHLVADMIKNHMEKIPDNYKSGRMIICGPHARNGFLRHLLGLNILGKKLENTDSAGIPAPSWDAFARAMLACHALDGGTLNSINSRGINRPLASFYPGANASWGKCLRWMERHSRQAG